jgi:hypothetical protein
LRLNSAESAPLLFTAPLAFNLLSNWRAGGGTGARTYLKVYVSDFFNVYREED